MVVVTWGHKEVGGIFPNLGLCPTCQINAACGISIYYTFVGVFWICHFCTGKVFNVRCRQCGRNRTISWTARWKASNKLIPLKDRYGFVILAVVIAVLVFLCR